MDVDGEGEESGAAGGLIVEDSAAEFGEEGMGGGAPGTEVVSHVYEGGGACVCKITLLCGWVCTHVCVKGGGGGGETVIGGKGVCEG
jgi:hypothetical protein